MQKMPIQSEMELYTGQISFTLFHLFGLWKPLTWNSQWKILLYHIYSIFMLTVFFTFTFSLLIYLLRVPQDIDMFTENLYYFLSFFAIFIKQISIMVKRKTAIDSNNMLLDKFCQPRDFHESEVLQKCSQVCRSNMIIFLIVLNITAASIVLSPLAKQSTLTLPMPGWFPYSLESKFAFLLTYLYQIIAIMMAVCTTASAEGLALVIMLHICAQLEIIVYRLHLLSDFNKKNDSASINCQLESKIITDCVKHHVYMYSLGEKLNELFGFMIFFQFLTTLTNLGIVVYQLSRLNLQNPTFWTMIASVSSVTVQIFLYCFYGEKLAEKSTRIADAVYRINHIALTNRTEKDLILMMIRATRPIKLTGLSLVEMSIETFVNIVKSSYSAYNLLRST